jgi:hypothetical protein
MLDGDGFMLSYGNTEIWYSLETHAINYGQDMCPECDIITYDAAGVVKQRDFSARPIGRDAA